MIEFIPTHRAATFDDFGILPEFFDEADPRPAKEQLHERYAHGGGFIPFNGFKLEVDVEGQFSLAYPEDPAMVEIGRAKLHERETIVLFTSSWLAIIQEDGTHVVCRVD